MKLERFLIFGAAFKFVFASENEIEGAASKTKALINPLSTQRRTAIIRYNTVNIPINNEHDYNDYNDHNEYDVRIGRSMTSNPLYGVRRTAYPIKTDNQNSVSSLFPYPVDLPIEKPLPNEFDRDSENEEEEVTVEDLLSMIPDRFSVNENGGTYEIYEAEEYMSSADIMKKRGALYRLLAEVYGLIDMFDFDNFKKFLGRGKLVLEHRDLRYHLIENLVKRSFKTTNEGTLNSLARFIDMIDSASVGRTVGQEERDIFNKFKEGIQEEGRKHQLCSQIESVLINFFTNEEKRLDPLRESLSSGDFNTAIGIIKSSNHFIFLSFDDFNIILGLPCSSARFRFMVWAIENCHFNPHERFEEEFKTPLMLAAMCENWSNDIVKAILLKAPETQNLESAAGLTALQYARANQKLKKSHRKPLIEMLELENPTYEALNEVLNKQILLKKKLI